MEPTKRKAIICDIDGTLAHMTDRGPFDWFKVGSDSLDEIVAEILTSFAVYAKADILLVSGRDGVCRTHTEDWLSANGIVYDQLFMRPDHNNEKDVVIKQRIYDNDIKDEYDVLFVLDDRDQVVDMWRNNGLKCLQVAAGNF